MARTLLSRLELPPGTRLAPGRPVPPLRPPAGTPPGPDSVDVHRLFSVPVAMRAGRQFLLAHVPYGKPFGIGVASGPAGVTAFQVNAIVRAEPRGIYLASLDTIVVPGPARHGPAPRRRGSDLVPDALGG
ncbi:MAG: hypothetical protein ABJB47_06215 [Actinomycetota bacterium]